MIRVVTKDNIETDFAIFIDFDDETLDLLRAYPLLMKDSDFVQMMPYMKGDNAHILQLTLNNNFNVFDYIDNLLEKYKSVSWFRKDKLYVRRRKFSKREKVL